MAVTKIAHLSVEKRRASGNRTHTQPSSSARAGREPVSGLLGGGSRSLEVRWIHRGRLPPSVIDRFGPFRDPIELRSDRYLVDPWTPELGVKIRGAVQLDLKAYRGSPGRLSVHGGGGPLEVWEKWTFPLGETSPDENAEGWVTLDKTRRRRAFELTADGIRERSVLGAVEPGCTFELTEVVGEGQVWWTLGFEASGASETLELSLRACADLLLDRPLPDRVKLSSNASMSYTRWLPLFLQSTNFRGRPAHLETRELADLEATKERGDAADGSAREPG